MGSVQHRNARGCPTGPGGCLSFHVFLLAVVTCLPCFCSLWPQQSSWNPTVSNRSSMHYLLAYLWPTTILCTDFWSCRAWGSLSLSWQLDFGVSPYSVLSTPALKPRPCCDWFGLDSMDQLWKDDHCSWFLVAETEKMERDKGGRDEKEWQRQRNRETLWWFSQSS